MYKSYIKDKLFELHTEVQSIEKEIDKKREILSILTNEVLNLTEKVNLKLLQIKRIEDDKNNIK